MTWLEFKRRAEELGIQDSDETAIDAIDDQGRAVFKTIALRLPPIPYLIVDSKVRKS